MLRMLKNNYLIFLSVRNLTAITILDNAKTINISKSSQYISKTRAHAQLWI